MGPVVPANPKSIYYPAMDSLDWISDFAKLHEKAKKTMLDGEELKLYCSGRDELTRAMLVAQGLTAKAGETPRQFLRVARTVPIALELPTGLVHALTIDIGRGGFAATLDKAPPETESVPFTLTLPAGRAPVFGRCKLVTAARQQGNVGAGFAFQDLSEADADRIESFVLDAVIKRLRGA
jgi:hypothetical protein